MWHCYSHRLLPWPRLCDQIGLSVIRSVTFSLFVCKITAKVISRFHWNLMLDWAYLILDHFSTSSPWRNSRLLAFLIQLPADFHDTLWNDCRRQGKESATFWKWSGRHPDPNLDSNSISLFLEILPFQRFVLCQHSLVNKVM